MSPSKELKSKVTYSYDQRRILILKETFERDLNSFIKLLEGNPQDWTYTVIQEGSKKELVVNVPAKKKS